MRILVACEESQTVCKAFREKGHEAYSCDILASSGGRPEWHLQKDVFIELPYSGRNTVQIQGKHDPKRWDLVISFPPCTDLTVSGARWFDKKRLSGEQERSIWFFLNTWYYSNCVENPVNIMGGWAYLRTWFPKIVEWMKDNNFPRWATQTIHPWQYGHRSSKETKLWLNGLPDLKATRIVGPPKKYDEMSPEELKMWTSVHRAPPGPNRSVLRSKTYKGIAEAMAAQWG